MSNINEGRRMISPKKADTFCWTCRRRRINCDKTLPTCLKCKKGGKECLGYTKPLKWNDGVASRGKMMGKTYAQSRLVVEDISSPDTVDEASSRSSTPSSISTYDDPSTETNQLTQFIPQTLFSIKNNLVDPIFQDMKPITRYYVDYFAKNICPESVLHDLPGQNPFRNLISVIGTSPLLLKAMLATAARHHTNLTDPSVTFMHSPANTDNELVMPSHDLSKAKYYAYWYKQQALAQLRKDLKQSTITGPKCDAIVASISLFIWMDLLENGKDTWRVHLEGMKRLVGLEDSVVADSKIDTMVHSDADYSITNVAQHPFFFDLCIAFDIMGATLSRPYKIDKPLPSTALAPTDTVYRSLMRAERTLFIGCPAELMFLILAINWRCWSSAHASQTSDQSPSSTPFTSQSETFDRETFTNQALLRRINSFDPHEWARRTTAFIPGPDTKERTHLGQAYQNAVLIYFHRTIEPILEGGSGDDCPTKPLTSLAHSTLSLLSLIRKDHPFFKCIIWPTFIAGAELITEACFAPPMFIDPSNLLEPIAAPMVNYRDLARQLLYNFWLGYRSINVVNAARLLEKIWQKNDQTAQKMSKEEYDAIGKSGVWSKGVLNCPDVKGPDGWNDHWIGEDVDWLFV